MSESPTPRELLIQLQNLAAQVTGLVARVDGLANTLSQTYVPRGEFTEARRGDGREFKELRGDIEELKSARAGDQTWRRSMSLAIAIAVIGWVVTIALAVVTLMSR